MESIDIEDEQAIGEESDQPEANPAVADNEGLQLLVTTQDGSLALWQDGVLYELADTEGVFAAVFVGESDNIAYVRGHEAWCRDTHTQEAHQVPLPPELVAIIPYEYDLLQHIFWLTPVANHSQVVGTVIGDSAMYGTILVDCGTYTSELINSTNPGNPIVAPDGSKIAIAGWEAISVYDIASGVTKVLHSFEYIYTYTAALFRPILSWSSDSTHIITVIHPQDWWIEQVDEPSVVYRMDIESGEVEAVAYIDRMFVREPHTAVPFWAEKLAYSIPADPLDVPFGIIPTRQIVLDLSNNEESLLFEAEATAGFIGWDPLSGITGFTGWNPSGDRVSFWEGSRPGNVRLGVYDFRTGNQLEQRLPGTFAGTFGGRVNAFAGWVSDTSFLYIADGILYLASIVGSEITSLEVAVNIDRVHQARVLK